MLKVIIESFKNLVTFLVFLYTLLFILTICKYVSISDPNMRFKDLGLQSYSRMFGVNPEYADIKGEYF